MTRSLQTATRPTTTRLVTTRTAASVRMSRNAAIRLGHVLGVREWPAGLGLVSDYPTDEQWATACAAADAELDAGGLVVDGRVRADVAAAVVAVVNPVAWIDVRVVDASGLRQTSIRRTADDCWLAERDEAGFAVERLDLTTDDDLSRVVVSRLPHASPSALVGVVTAPMADLVAAIDGRVDPRDVVDGLYRAGVAAPGVSAVAETVVGCSRHVEVVAFERVDGETHEAAGSVAVYDSPQGRLVAAPSVAPDLSRWTTMSAGSEHRIRQAIGLLIETLPSRRWMP